MRKFKQPLSQDAAYLKANARARLAAWFDIGAAALIFYIFT